VTTKTPSNSSAAPGHSPTAAKPRRRASTPRARRARPLVTAPPEKCFWVHHGPVLRDLRELRDALERQISDGQFAHHVGPERNDFADWVEHVLGEKTCARALRRVHSVSAALGAVETALRGR
jgi:hypothetical protein